MGLEVWGLKSSLQGYCNAALFVIIFLKVDYPNGHLQSSILNILSIMTNYDPVFFYTNRLEKVNPENPDNPTLISLIQSVILKMFT